ncbi:ribosomal protein L31 [Tannerella forsythia KS16]|jgi:ribosomal protein L31|nr:ribosomal protein L31 [Tannerella forsythia 3313]BAR53154.1 ribosomal protein L31 [Tannerella forsythia KS16]
MHVIFFMAVCINHTGQCYELEFYRFFLACLNNYEYFCTPYFGSKIITIKNRRIMKKELHPENYRQVAFKDMSNEEVFITRSTINTRETIEIDGVTYPLVKLEISSSSHPFYTGKAKLVDTAGRVDKFMSRYGNRNKK